MASLATSFYICAWLFALAFLLACLLCWLCNVLKIKIIKTTNRNAVITRAFLTLIISLTYKKIRVICVFRRVEARNGNGARGFIRQRKTTGVAPSPTRNCKGTFQCKKNVDKNKMTVYDNDVSKRRNVFYEKSHWIFKSIDERTK